MKKAARLLFSHSFLFFIIFSLSFFSIKSDDFHDINEDVPGTSEYKKASFDSEPTKRNHFFKYTVTNVPKSRIGALRFDFDNFNPLSQSNKVFCAFVDQQTSDKELENILRALTDEDTACVGEFNSEGIYNGIIEYDTSKKKLGIYLVAGGLIRFSATVYLRITEKFLDVKEQTVFDDEIYSLIPYTVVISDFREKCSKILFYSSTRELQMYYVEQETLYPEKLFSGNIMSVYTNPNMVHQKYHDANYMVLLTRNFTQEIPASEQFQFEVKLYPSNYLLDYYVSDNQEGRSKNSPLAINMTECEYPYYVVLNYNKPENEISLYIDQIYGKVNSLSVATNFSSLTWEEMIVNDMKPITVSSRKYDLVKESKAHMDVYKVECEIPVLLNFYYVDETANIPDLDYGQVAITTLKAYKSISLPFVPGIILPELTIEVFNPTKLPFVIVNDGQNENIVEKNSLIRSMPFTTTNPIVIKEKGGDSNTRVIIKVGYKGSFKPHSDNVEYNAELNLYVFSFPNNEKRLNYTFAHLVTKGAKGVDNVKYCYGTNIGSAILPSKENCYRVSETNSYTLKVLNPFVMHKDYDIDEDLTYYVSLKPVDTQQLDITAELHTYDTEERNIEGVANNILIESSGIKNSILSAPKNRDVSIFLQIEKCDTTSQLSMKILNAYNNTQTVVEEETVTKGFNKIFKNILLETELQLKGESGKNVFVKHAGIRSNYNPGIKDTYSIIFRPESNQLEVESPINVYERIKYIVLVSAKGGLSSKGITLCSFTDEKTTSSFYNKTVESFNVKTSITINFKKVGLQEGDEFEALVYSEQEINSKMAFLSNIISDKVGKIDEKSITEIKTPYDDEYVYAKDTASADKLTYYFSFLPSQAFDVPVGAFNIELDADTTNGFTSVDCAFVNDGEDPISMVEAVEDVIDSGNPYCIGGQSSINKKIYRFIFKYSYTSNNETRRLVIKISNGEFAVGGFSIYVRNFPNIYLESTDFTEQKEYGKQEEYKKSVVPYIVDLAEIRGKDATNYISKILIYSKFLEMQMYYINEELNAPIILFTGNIMLVLTKLDLAIQKYHSTKLILLSENLNGQEHSSLGNQFRFHTKMFKTDDQIEYFVSNNSTGRTLNYPLSLEMNTCTSTNYKYYYILNYNKPEGERILYLDLVFGSIKNARIANEITEEKWDSLIDKMNDIKDYTVTLSSKSQHIDIVEIECNTPLLANAYYNYENQTFEGLGKGEIAVKLLKAKESTKITLDTAIGGYFYYSVSLFNQVENPDVNIVFSDGSSHHIYENALQTGFLTNFPESISIVNNGETSTRFIFKIGYGPESEKDWEEDTTLDIEGTLYSKDNKYIYKFPYENNKKNFTNVSITVKPLRRGSEAESPNIKFCYSTSLGMPIDVSLENCFRTGANIYYTLNFINPLISRKTYKTYSDFYYVTLSTFYYTEYISLDITENKYDTYERNIEGIGKSITLNQGREKSTILSLPEAITDTNVLLQLQICSSTDNEIIYKILKAYNGEQIIENSLSKSEKLYYYTLSNNLMETELKLIGQSNDIIFTKHTGLGNYQIQIQPYKTSFESGSNVAIIDKPILNEEFRITVLVGKNRNFKEYSLCTFAGKKEEDYRTLGDYVNSFTSVSSNIITHYIDFSSIGYVEGDEFELLVYAVQTRNSKLEFLYDVLTEKVGKVEAVIQINNQIPGKADYISKEFYKNTTSNYLYYQFGRDPVGFVSSLKIKPQSDEESEEGMIISKVGCTFVGKDASDEEMVRAVNDAMRLGTSVCIGESQKDKNGFDALINAKDLSSGSGNRRLVIQVIYGLGDEEKNNEKIRDSIALNITIRINGFSVENPDYEYKEEEQLTLVPYVLDLLKIRGDDEKNYVSKVLLFSNTREMQMFYLGNNGAPVELFSGNIMLVYTNEELIREKYFGATTMILVTDSFSSTQKTYFGEQFKFKVSFFDSKSTIQYYVSANPTGRLLNNPTAIEMLACDQPYYYILNYHQFESNRILHIDNIFGEVNTMKISTQLSDNNWFDFISNLEPFEGNEYYIKEQSKYHIDVLEVTCKTPLLLNVYYTDPVAPKKTNLDEGDISIVSLYPGTSETLTFQLGLTGDFVFSFNVWRENNLPNIYVSFEDEDSLEIRQNGIFTKQTNKNYYLITIYNRALSGADQTKVIFKFGYVVEKTFTKISNDMYNLQTKERPANLFAYIFKNGEDRLNYTKVDFLVETKDDNVKFCYTSNLGAYIDPSLQNCYRVGPKNPYTISVLNPYVMYKNYYTGEDTMKYYASFRTENISLNITITPTLNYYSTKNRNIEGYPSLLSLKKTESTILTIPSSNTKYTFVQMHVCTNDKSISYNFTNAYDNSSLKEQGNIPINSQNNYKSIENINLDVLLTFENIMQSDEDTVKIFVRHIGANVKYTPLVNPLKISFNKANREVRFNQPILGENFKYTIYLDKKNNLKKLNVTLCTFAELSKVGHYSQSFESDKENVTQTIDFNKAELKGYETFDLLVLAQEKNNEQFMVLSDLISGTIIGSDGGSGSNIALVVVIIILVIIIVVGGLFLFLCLRRYKNKPMENVIIAKPTNLDDIQSANKGEKMLDSMAQSQAYENQN